MSTHSTLVGTIALGCKGNTYLCNLQEISAKKLWGRKDLGYGVVARASPGIASQDAPNGEIEALEGTMLDDGLSCILTTGGRKATGWRCIGRDSGLVEADGHHQQPDQRSCDIVPEGFHNFSLIRCIRLATRCSTASVVNWLSDNHINANNNCASSGKAAANNCLWRRQPSRICLFTRLRSTA